MEWQALLQNSTRLETGVSEKFKTLYYNVTTKKLYAEFHNRKDRAAQGNVYEYDEVPQDVVDSITNAADTPGQSVGSVFHELVIKHWGAEHYRCLYKAA